MQSFSILTHPYLELKKKSSASEHQTLLESHSFREKYKKKIEETIEVANSWLKIGFIPLCQNLNQQMQRENTIFAHYSKIEIDR